MPYFIESKLKDARKQIFLEEIDVDPQIMDALEEMIIASHELAKERTDHPIEGENQDYPIPENEMNAYKNSIKKLYSVLNCPVEGGTIKQLTSFNHNEDDGVACREDLEFLDKNLEFKNTVLKTGWAKDDEPFIGPVGRFKQTKKQGGREWFRIKSAYKNMSARLSDITDNPDLSDEDIKDIAGWKACFDALAAPADPENPNQEEDKSLKQLLTKGKLDKFLQKKVGEKTILQLMQGKVSKEEKKLYGLSNALDSIQSFHKVKITHNVRTRSGYDWIDSVNKKNHFIIQKDGKKVYKTTYFAIIIAARQLSNAVEGKPDNLQNTKLNAVSIQERAEKLENEPLYKMFIKSLEKDEKLMNKAIDAACTGHGGKLEKQFKEFLLKQPAGMLPNKPIFARYMPTVKSRIEFLQKQAANGADSAATMAEIISLRKIAHVNRRHKKDLEVRIPVDSKNSLQNCTAILMDDPDFKKVAASKEVTDIIGKGHGGEAMMNIRKTMVKKGHKNKILESVSIDGRMEINKIKAGKLYRWIDKLEDKREITPDIEKKFKEEYKKVMKEYFVLDELLNEYVVPYSGKKGKMFGMYEQVAEGVFQGGKQEVDWNEYNDYMKNPEKVHAMSLLNKDLPLKEMKNILRKVHTFNHVMSIQELADRYPEIVKPEPPVEQKTKIQKKSAPKSSRKM